ncbi:ABC transporter substrate-binding protein [Nocardioides dubius]|uniref:ABC transporter substrate-binding protein n=1 Tax=Nocardioides dubius TaxID=317019 RepID=A0ABN1TW93_9ACTN
MSKKPRTQLAAPAIGDTTRRRPFGARRALVAVSAAVLTTTLLAACGSASSDSGSGGEAGVLNIANAADIPAYDPVVLGPTGATQTLSLVYESLFTLDEQGEIQPALATEYTFNETGTQLTLTLREGLTFQDGTPLDAEAVAYHLERGRTQENSALKPAYHQIKSVQAVDATHVQIDLKQADFGFPLVLANRSALIASKAAAEKDLKALNANEPVGAGPFKVVKVVPGASITLEKWDGYWDADNIHVDKVKVSLGTDPATVLSGLQTGVYNFVPGLAPQNLETAKSSGLKVVADTSANWVASFVNINRQLAPFDNPQVVEAFNAAIDRDALVKTLTFGLGDATANPVPPTNPAFNPAIDEEVGFDPEKAKQLLEESGAKDLSFKIHVFPTMTAPAEQLQQQLEAVGFDVEIVAEDTTSFYPGYYGKTQQAALYGYVGRDNKLLSLDEHFSEAGILNLSASEDPAYTAAREQVLKTPLDDPAYKTRLRAASKAGVETGSTVFLYTTPTVSATSADVSDFPKTDGIFRWNGITVG